MKKLFFNSTYFKKLLQKSNSMKKIFPLTMFFLLFAIASCTDDDDPNDSPSPSFQQDSQFMGGWLLDSIADSVITNSFIIPDGSILGSLPPTSDSIAFSASAFESFKWVSTHYTSSAIVSQVVWNSQNGDSLRLFLGNYSTRWVSYDYSFSGQVLQLKIDSYQLNPPEHRLVWYWYHKAN